MQAQRINLWLKAGATRQISHTRPFGLSEAMAFAYVKDSRFVLLRCLLLGLGVWWYLPLIGSTNGLLLT